LGDGTRVTHSTPVDVQGGLRFVELSGGDSHICGRTADGRAFCWGSNGNGQVGNGSLDPSELVVPTSVVGDHRFTALTSAASHTCGLTADAAYCWGYDGYGQLGDGNSLERVSSPTLVQSSVRFVEISAGGFHTCARSANGMAYCWGKNDAGSIGDGTQMNRWRPVAVAGDLHFLQLDLGSTSTCGIATQRQTFCWGDNSHAQLGIGSTQPSGVPALVGW
jgi:alpha-tubulin suppressor-like RCC1 family protein